MSAGDTGSADSLAVLKLFTPHHHKSVSTRGYWNTPDTWRMPDHAALRARCCYYSLARLMRCDLLCLGDDIRIGCLIVRRCRVTFASGS